MDTEARTGRREELRYCLKELSQGFGIYRSDLLKVLNSELRSLREVWGVNVNDEKYARKIVKINLRAHIDSLVPRSEAGPFVEQRAKGKYFNAVELGFNTGNEPVAEGVESPGFETMLLTKRRTWLQDDAPKFGLASVSIRASQRYFDDAVEQIIDLMLSDDYKPVVVEEDSSKAAEVGDQEPSTLEPEGPEANVRRRETIKQVLLASSAIIVLTVVFLLGTWTARGGGESTQPPPTSLSSSGSKILFDGAPTDLALKEGGIFTSYSGGTAIRTDGKLPRFAYFPIGSDKTGSRLVLVAVGGMDSSPRVSALHGRISLHNERCGPLDVVAKIGFGHPRQTIDGGAEFDLTHKLPPIENGEAITIEFTLSKARNTDPNCGEVIVDLDDFRLEPVA